MYLRFFKIKPPCCTFHFTRSPKDSHSKKTCQFICSILVYTIKASKIKFDRSQDLFNTIMATKKERTDMKRIIMSRN